MAPELETQGAVNAAGRNSTRALSVYIIAGEASGDAIGARLISSLHERSKGPITLAGVGGVEMSNEGFESLFPIKEIAVMGLLEVIPHIPRLKRLIRMTAEDIAQRKPDVLVTIDAPGFCKRVVDALPTDLQTIKVHYVAPSVWAWRPNRVHGFKRRFDMLLTLLPFEPPYFDAVNLPAEFVGHPVLQSGADRGDGAKFRRENDIGPDDPVLCLLPGSRLGEVSRLLVPFLEAANRIREAVPALRIVIPTVASVADTVARGIGEQPKGIVITVDQALKYDAMAASNAAIAASGTVALELAMAKVPTVVAYRVNWITYQIVRRLIGIKYVHLLNYMADRPIVPELLQHECHPIRLAEVLLTIIGPEGLTQTNSLAPHLEKLRPDAATNGRAIKPSDAATNVILSLVNR